MRNAGVIRLVEPQILIVRGQRVILDLDLAALYGVTAKRLNEQVKRNAARFPEDFMFRLTPEEADRMEAADICRMRLQNMARSWRRVF